MPEVNERFSALRCVSDTRLFRLVETSGGLNNLTREDITKLIRAMHNAWADNWRVSVTEERGNICVKKRYFDDLIPRTFSGFNSLTGLSLCRFFLP